jgi:hypothetical protein
MTKTFWRFGKFFCCYLVAFITYPFGLHLFFFNAHNSLVWSFDGVAEFLLIPFAALVLFD